MEFIIEKKKPKKIYIIPFLLGLIFFAYLGFLNASSGFEEFNSNISEINSSRFEGIIFFYQPNCPHCIEEIPLIHEINKEIPVLAINIIDHRELISKYDIKKTPTVFYKNSKGFFEISHLDSYDQIMNFIKNPVKNYLKQNSSKNIEGCSLEINDVSKKIYEGEDSCSV